MGVGEEARITDFCWPESLQRVQNNIVEYIDRVALVLLHVAQVALCIPLVDLCEVHF